MDYVDIIKNKLKSVKDSYEFTELCSQLSIDDLNYIYGQYGGSNRHLLRVKINYLLPETEQFDKIVWNAILDRTLLGE